MHNDQPKLSFFEPHVTFTTYDYERHDDLALLGKIAKM
jgi:hypothetical protein